MHAAMREPVFTAFSMGCVGVESGDPGSLHITAGVQDACPGGYPVVARLGRPAAVKTSSVSR